LNKAQLIDELAQRLGDKRTAGAAVDGMVDVIVRTVQKGERVNITGFGVFEKRARAARTARNPRTGETVKVRKTNVPAFRAGTTFKDVVSGAKKLPRVTATAAVRPKVTSGNSSAPSARATSTRAAAARPATSRTASRAASRTTGPAKSAAATKPAAKASSKSGTKSTATKAAAKSTATKAPKTAAKSTSTRASTKKASAKKK
jgi:DNA-binding protein HU-beta